ncbi:MAG: YdeI/OmpD-associated family protein [Chthoniobacterales bacterium]|nr:YdeI/OmpD-associated family protein [Chthoniobacterales bacterium]
MSKKDPRLDAYIAKAAPFARPILKHLRKIVHTGCPEVQETMKWSMPHFDYKGPMSGMAAFKQHCTFGFWKASLVFGEPAGTEAMGHFGRITKIDDLPAEKVLIGYVRKAVELNDAGLKIPRAKPVTRTAPLLVPDYFRNALRQNGKAAKTFDGFSYSKRKKYVVWVIEAKREETREQRLATSIKWLAEGKSLNWKYQPK